VRDDSSKTPNITLEDLYIIRSVVREGGVVRAATWLRRAPSNVTTRIKQFEGRLGVQLFHRQGRRLALTDAGKTLLAHAESLLRMADLAEQETCSDVVRGTLRIGASEPALVIGLPPFLSALRSRNPQISIELTSGTDSELLRLLGRFEIDAAFVSQPFDRTALSTRPAFEDELVLITSKSGPALRKVNDLRGQTIIGFPPGCSHRRRLVEWLADAGVSPRGMIDVGSYAAIVALVAAGTGVAIVPAQLIAQDRTLGSAIDHYPPPSRVRVSRTLLVWSGNASPALHEFVKALPSQNSARRRSRQAGV
jgi:DNA-binding transcriptional LysR family regulator